MNRWLAGVVLLGWMSWAQSPEEMLRAHNEVRSRLHLPPLEWSTKLAAVAQEWATRLLEHDQFMHRPNWRMAKIYSRSGERRLRPNEWSVNGRPRRAIMITPHGACGHYTQIVWRDTKEVGCGVAQSGRRQIWVCDYSPPGNIVGRRPY